MDILPSYVWLTPARRKLLEQLKDGKWHRKFPGIGIGTFDLMMVLDFIQMRFIDKKRHPGRVEARITATGRYLLEHKQCNMRYEGRKITIAEMKK